MTDDFDGPYTWADARDTYHWHLREAKDADTYRDARPALLAAESLALVCWGRAHGERFEAWRRRLEVARELQAVAEDLCSEEAA